MQHVYVVTEDMFIFGIRSSNSITDVHVDPESAENEINTYMVKNDLIDGYKIASDEWTGETHTVILKKWGGILRRIIVLKKALMHECRKDNEVDRDLH